MAVTQAPHMHTPNRRGHVVGVLIVIAVALIWTFAAELIQFILQGKGSSYDKPYFLTYFSVSLFSVLLTGFALPSWRAAARWETVQPAERPMRSMSNPAIMEGEFDMDYEADQPVRPELSVRSVLKVGAQLAPFFFMSSWTYNLGLDMTSVASSSTISALTTLFTLALGASIGSVRFTMGKLIATALSIAGVTIISQQDTSEGKRSLAGDVISIGSSFIYALYTILLDRHTDSGTFSMSMMLGFLGFVTLITFWPGLFICALLGWESFEMPKGKILAMLLVNGFIGTVLSDFLWAKSVELAGPMIGTLSLSLAVPFSVTADYFLNDKEFALVYLLGTVLVLTGFLLMNYEIARDRQRENELVADSEIVSEMETLSQSTSTRRMNIVLENVSHPSNITTNTAGFANTTS